MRIFLPSLLSRAIFGLSLAVLTGAAEAEKGTLVIEISGFKNAAGGAAVALYAQDEADGFPREPDRAKEATYLPIAKDGTLRWELADLPFGSYAAILFHDEDGNRRLATNFIGIPKEGLGISNDFKPRFGPPGFDDARFAFTRSRQVIKIEMQY